MLAWWNVHGGMLAWNVSMIHVHAKFHDGMLSMMECYTNMLAPWNVSMMEC